MQWFDLNFIFTISVTLEKNACRVKAVFHNIPRGTEFFFVFFELFLPESSHTKKNSAPRGIFRLVENSL